MKSKKIISALFLLIFLLNVSVSKSFAQIAENIKPTEKSDVLVKNSSASSEENKNAKSALQKNDESVSRNSSSSNNDRYRIGYQDTVEVLVARHPDLSLNVHVNPDGTIFLPRLEAPIVAACKTEAELKDNITELYKQNYLVNPFVSVRVSERKSQGFAVIGAVKNPGKFYLDQKVRLLELLSLAGGQDVEFAGGKIQVARLGNISGCKEPGEIQNTNDDVVFTSYSLRDVTEGKENPWMQPGDIISVLKSEEVYVIGNVFKPTKVQLDEPKTLTQAIASAGGKDSTASDKVVIRRQTAGSSPQTDLVFSLNDINNKKIPDPQLQANDIIDVGTDKIKTVRNGVLKALAGGIGGLFYGL